jgi:hypothetical protein
MSTAIAEPPAITGTDTFEISFELRDSLHFYLSYEYLPLKNISILIKNVDELYDLIYLLLHNEKVPKIYRLSLDYAETGNSFDWIAKLIEIIKPSRKAMIALSMTAAVIYTPIGIEKYNRDVAERHQIEAGSEKTKAETNKIKAEKESIDLENLMRKNKIAQDSIARVNAEKNRKKIIRKRNAIKKAISDKPINQCVINNIIIFNRDSD